MNTRVKGSSIDFAATTLMTSLLDLGPVGSDITVGLQLALNSGKSILIPYGTWIASGIIIPDNSVMIGLGDGSFLKLKDAANAVQLIVGSGCYLKDFVLDGNKVNQVGSGFNAINLNNSVRSRILNVTAKNTKGSGFYVSGTSAENDIIGCSATGFTECGIKVVATANLSIVHPNIYSSDASATGDGIALISAGNNISGVSIVRPKIKDVTGRGIALVGNGSKNVFDVMIDMPSIYSVTGHGIHAFTAESMTINAGVVRGNGGDGIRLEGDVQNSRVINAQIKNNVGYGLREVANGSTPNNNGLMYNYLAGNANNVQTKLGAQSFVL